METMTQEIKLDSDHRYFVGDKRVPGFTEICKSLGVIKDNNFYTDEGRDEGNALHQWMLFLAQGQEPEAEPDPRIAGRVQGFRKFLADTGFQFKGGETPLYDPVSRFACTPDVWGGIYPHTYVIDVKRGAKLPWHVLQTAAQKLALGAYGFRAQKRASLYLKDGDYRLVQHEDEDDLKRWQALVTAYHAKSFYGEER